MELSCQDLMGNFGVTDEDCNKEVSDEHVEMISRSHCEDWESLLPYLGLKPIVANDIGKQNLEPREKRKKFLSQWKKIEGDNATYQQLVKALLKIQCRQDAEMILKMLQPPTAQSLPSSGAKSASDRAGKHDFGHEEF